MRVFGAVKASVVLCPDWRQIDHLAGSTRFVHGNRQDAGFDGVERRNRKGSACRDMGKDIGGHLLVSAVMVRFHRWGLIGVADQLGAVMAR